MALVNATFFIKIFMDVLTIKDFRRATAVKYLKLGLIRKVLKGRHYSFLSNPKCSVSGDIHYDL